MIKRNKGKGIECTQQREKRICRAKVKGVVENSNAGTYTKTLSIKKSLHNKYYGKF
jgi:hypothetical protein